MDGAALQPIEEDNTLSDANGAIGAAYIATAPAISALDLWMRSEKKGRNFGGIIG